MIARKRAIVVKIDISLDIFNSPITLDHWTYEIPVPSPPNVIYGGWSFPWTSVIMAVSVDIQPKFH